MTGVDRLVNRQIGDYVFDEIKATPRDDNHAYAVRMAGAVEYLSYHATITDAVHQILIYQAADKRRQEKAR